MASLVADYGTSSGSDSDSEESTPNTHKPKTQNTTGINFLESTADGKDDSDSDEDAQSEAASDARTTSSAAVHKHSLLPNPLAASKLPSPALGADRPPETSVFVTSFHRAAEAKSSILEQHVKMTDTDLPAEVGGKKICWNFRKGKCRFGHKCKYSHGQEILGLGAPKANGEEADGGSSNSVNTPQQTTHQQHGHGHVHGAHGYGGAPGPYHGHHSNRGGYPPHGNHGYRQPWPQQAESEAPVDEDDYLTNAKNKKKRVGVSDTMVPPKRAMREFDRFRQEERPWTLPQ